MTILLHNYLELDEKTSTSLRVWKGWHIALYILAAIFGLLNYSFFHSTNQLLDDHCVLFPRKLHFRIAQLPNATAYVADGKNATEENEKVSFVSNTSNDELELNSTRAVNSEFSNGTDVMKRTKRNIHDDFDIAIRNFTLVNNSTRGNKTHRLVLHTSRTLFAHYDECEFAMYMPIVSTIFALVWVTFFTMCPGGGRSRSGLSQPWRILTPAFIFSFVFVVLTGCSFTKTNGGLQAFCASFENVTNTTTCSAVNPHIELAWNTSWGIGGRVAATRAASAGVWASWACVCALLLARCFAAPDFSVKRTEILLKNHPSDINSKGKTSPKKTRSLLKSDHMDDASAMSEPTLTSELVTASIETHGQETKPSSLTTSPMKQQERPADVMELTYIPRQ